MRKTRKLPLLALLVLAVLTMLLGCGPPLASQTETAATPAPHSYFDGAITVELIAPSSLPRGGILQLDVLMTNHGGKPFRFVHGPQVGLTVLAEDGGEVFRHPVRPIRSSHMEDPDDLPFELAPGESVALDSLWRIPARMFGAGGSAWDLRDEDLLTIAPGAYELHTAIAVVKEGTREPAVLEMPVHRLVVEESMLGDLTAGLELELLAPESAPAGEPVPLDMRVTNTNDASVTLRFGDAAIGGRLAHRQHYLDVLVFRGEDILWSGLRAEGVNTGWAVSFLTLAPGESRTLSGLFRGFSETPWEVYPWEWGGPVQPGLYTLRGLASVADPDGRGYVTIGTEYELMITP